MTGSSTPRPRAAESKRPGHRRRVVQLLLVFLASVIVVDALVGDQGLLAMLRARRQYDELATTIARGRSENLRLRDEARRLREDPTAIEAIARRELGLIKPGETVFIVKDVSSAALSRRGAAPPQLPASPTESEPRR